jgi:hypothetical protein
MTDKRKLLALPLTVFLFAITNNYSHAVEQDNVKHENMVERKSEQICGSDTACIERMRNMMNSRYDQYREIRLDHCQSDKKCIKEINKKYPKTDSEN